MNKGFTLVEVFAVVIILGIIAVVSVPSISHSLNSSKENLYKEQVKRIEDTAKKYALENTTILPEDDNKTVISLDILVDSGYLENKDIINPKNKAKMEGCVIVEYSLEKNKYVYNYSEELCE